MKKALYLTILIITLLVVYINQKTIVHHILDNFIYKKSIVVYNSNNYKRNYSFEFVKETDKFIVESKTDITNVLYTVLNNGWDEFTFYCDDNYNRCISDAKDIINDPTLLSNINNFVHPYNSYNTITITYNNLGKIVFTIEKLYSDTEISNLNNKIESIINDIITTDMTDKDRVKAIHDHIINNTKYDSERANNIKENRPTEASTYDSHKATGTLFQNMAICSGYSDAMAIFLNYLNIPNYKVSNDNHVWNLLYINDKWLHLDLTWDDPIVDTKEDLLLYTYFLITTEELDKKDNIDHYFDKTIFTEATK